MAEKEKALSEADWSCPSQPHEQNLDERADEEYSFSVKSIERSMSLKFIKKRLDEYSPQLFRKKPVLKKLDKKELPCYNKQEHSKVEIDFPTQLRNLKMFISDKSPNSLQKDRIYVQVNTPYSSLQPTPSPVKANESMHGIASSHLKPCSPSRNHFSQAKEASNKDGTFSLHPFRSTQGQVVAKGNANYKSQLKAPKHLPSESGTKMLNIDQLEIIRKRCENSPTKSILKSSLGERAEKIRRASITGKPLKIPTLSKVRFHDLLPNND